MNVNSLTLEFMAIIELESKKVSISGNNSNESVAASLSTTTTVIYKSLDST